MIRLTGLQAYQRNLKMMLEAARETLTEEEWQALRAMLVLWLANEDQRAA